MASQHALSSYLYDKRSFLPSSPSYDALKIRISIKKEYPKRQYRLQAKLGDPRKIDKSEKILDPFGKVDGAMSTQVVTVTPNDSLESVIPHFEHFTGLPVVDENGKCVGIISDVDVSRYARSRVESSLPSTLVRDVMTTPAIVILEHAPIAYAAGLMLRSNVHRLPVINKEGIVVGIVTRNDLFEPLIPGVDPLYHMVVGHDHDEPSSLLW